jgi:hypothetical protein
MSNVLSNRIVEVGQFLSNDSGHNFESLGNDFLKAAKILNKELQSAPEWPTYSMVFQSLELFLKSYLLRKGKELRYVEREIWHRLRLALDESKRLGLVLAVNPEVEEEVMQLSEVYTRKDFQYRKNGEWKVVPPDLVILFVESVARCL